MTFDSQTSAHGAKPLSAVGSDLKQDADRLVNSVSTRARQAAESRKGEAVQAAGSASAALNSAAEKLERNPDAPDWMATALQGAAKQIDRLAGHVNGRNIEDLGREIFEFARSNPGAFLAALAAAGFAAARVLRAGADKKRHGQPDDSDNVSAFTGKEYGVDTGMSGSADRQYGSDIDNQGSMS